MLAGRARVEGIVPDSGTSARITQFYARSAEIVDGERDVICYGVQNVKAIRLEPPVESLTPALVRCFWVAPRQDTVYKMIADGVDGTRAEASFEIQVRPAPPVFRMIAVSDKAIPQGEVVTVCYGVEHATAVQITRLSAPRLLDVAESDGLGEAYGGVAGGNELVADEAGVADVHQGSHDGGIVHLLGFVELGAAGDAGGVDVADQVVVLAEAPSSLDGSTEEVANFSMFSMPRSRTP